MKPSSALAYLSAGVASLHGAAAQSWKDIPTIEAEGQHFFYSNNGSQYFLKGVAYQQDYEPNGKTTSKKYTDPLADGAACARDIPYMKQIFTNVIRVYAVDPTVDHDDCMEQLASNDIYVLADLSETSTSIDSNDPSWDVTRYARYTAVIDAFAKYNNVIGFFAGNEVVSANNQTSAAAFVKAAVRDCKGYIRERGYRSSLGVGYATADVSTRDNLADYFACQPGDDGNATSIDFWGYNVYSWCGKSSYADSGYNERYNFFRSYPVPVFFAEYGCIEGIDGGPTHRPFDEIPVLFGRMSDVFSGGLVYSWFMGANKYGLVELEGTTSVKPYPDFTSLKNQLKTVSPTSIARASYTATNSAPACPTVDSSWAAKASPLPPSVNPQLCACEAAAAKCTVADGTEEADYADVFGYICGEGDYCDALASNATTGKYGAISGCSPRQQLAFVANLYYNDKGGDASACDFSGKATVASATTSAGCASLLSAAGTAGTGTVPSPTGKQGTAVATDGSGGSSSSSGAAVASFGGTPAFFEYGKFLFAAYSLVAVVSGVAMIAL